LPTKTGGRIEGKIRLTASLGTVRASVVQRLISVVALLVARPDQTVAATGRDALLGAGSVIGVGRTLIALLLAGVDHTVAAAGVEALGRASAVIGVARALVTFLVAGPDQTIAASGFEARAGARSIVAITIAVVAFLVSLDELVAADHGIARALPTGALSSARLGTAARRPTLAVAAHLVRGAASLAGLRLTAALRLHVIAAAR
jgi:hypothetical protein